MFIGGIQKNSFIDFPGKISCVLFVCGCNFRCPYCHNPSLVRPDLMKRDGIEMDAALDFIRRRRELLEGVVISGGEPTLSGGDLISLCREIKQMGYSVKLDTNGSGPRVLWQLIEGGLVDYIAMDIKTDPELYSTFSITNSDETKNILSSIRLIMESETSYEFRTTCVKPIVDASIIESIAHLINGADHYALQKFVSGKVLRPDFFRGFKAGYSEKELFHFKGLAEPWVKKCVVRY